MAEDARPITDLLRRMGQGDREGLDELVALLYTTLQRMCWSHLRKLPSGSLTPTALLHELYIDLAERYPDLGSRGEFFAYAHRAMKHLAIDSLRRAQAEKRGGKIEHLFIDEVELADERAGPEFELVEVFEVLARVAAQDPELANVVKLRVFDRLSLRAIARELGVDRKKVKVQWTAARSLLAYLLAVPGRKKDGAV